MSNLLDSNIFVLHITNKNTFSIYRIDRAIFLHALLLEMDAYNIHN